MQKRIISLLLAVCLVCGAVPVLASATVAETEGNDSFAQAQDIAVNETLTGSLMTSRDEDFFRFSLSESGWVSLRFEHDYIDSSSRYWNVRFFTDSYDEINDYSIYGNEVKSEFDGIGLPAGTYYVKITDSSYHSDILYCLTVSFTPSEDWETEFNNTFYTPDTVAVNNTVTGSIMNSADEDYYTFSLDGPGPVSLAFEHRFIDSASRYWNITFYTGDFKELVSYSIVGNEVKNTKNPIGLPAGQYYIKVTDSSYHSSAPYEMTIEYTASDTYETEMNDTFYTADTIQPDIVYAGSLMYSGDEDFYQVQIHEAALYTVRFQHKYIDSGSRYWNFQVFDGDYKTFGSFPIIGSDIETATKPFSLSPGTYYIKISASSYHSSTPYSFSLLTGPSEPTVSPSPDTPTPTPDVPAGTPSPTPGTPTPEPADRFRDVSMTHYARKAINWALINKITSGVSANIFGVGQNCQRSQAVFFIWAAEGRPEPTLSQNPFVDVKPSAYYYKAVLWAKEKGVTGGKSATTFDPTGNVTRGQIMTFLYAAQGKPAVSGSKNFSDVKPTDYYNKAVAWAAENGVSSGKGAGTFKPKDNCKREEIVTFLYQAYK